MKKTILIFGFIIPFCLTLTAQDNSRLVAEVSVGSSFPVGKFSNKAYSGNFLETKSAGLAKTGVCINLSAGYRLSKSFGVLVFFGGSQNKQDAASLIIT